MLLSAINNRCRPFTAKRSISNSSFLRLLVNVIFVLELLNTSATVDELLLTGEERMTCWANVKSHFFFCWSCNKSITTCASYFTFLIIRMDSFLHASTLFPARSWPVHKFTACIAAFILYHTYQEETSVFLPKRKIPRSDFSRRSGVEEGSTKKKKPQSVQLLIYKKWNRQRPTFPGSLPPSIIGAGELNGCVRDGYRCVLPAIVTGFLLRCTLKSEQQIASLVKSSVD